MSKKSTLLVGLLAACLWPVGQAAATQNVRLKVAFSPDRPNANTTIHFGFQIATDSGLVPSPVTTVDLKLPAGMGLGMTTLGEAVCTPAALETAEGSDGCSPNALMGLGHALIELPVGNEIVRNTAEVSIFMGPPVDRHTVMLFYANSVTPVSATIMFSGQLLPESGSFGASLNTAIPIIPTWPGGADAAVVNMQSTLGPEHLTYFRRAHGKRVGYRPIGMAVPAVCPRGGYRFAVNLSFQDGTKTSAASTVPCPH